MYTIFEKRERKMFVICPKCAAKYQIPAEITLKNGQKVQCSACQHVFHFEKEEVLVRLHRQIAFDNTQIAGRDGSSYHKALHSSNS